MSRRHEPDSDHARIDAEAAEWFIRRDAGLDPAAQRDFDRWLALDPRHAARFAEHERTWARFAPLADAAPQSEPAPMAIFPAPPSRVRRHFGLIAAVAAAFAVVFFGWNLHRHRSTLPPPTEVIAAHYETRILSDGSILELKGDSHLRTRFADGERSIWLLRGEAHFHVAKDAERPFVVYAQGASVRAVGTAFNVRVADQQIEVVVTEGTVRVAPPGADASDADFTYALAEYQRTVVTKPSADQTPPSTPKVQRVSPEDIPRLLSWRPAKLEFSGALLGDVVNAFNKRNRTQLVIADHALALRPVELSFQSDQLDAFVRTLQLAFNVRVERSGEHQIVLREGR